MSGYFDSQNAAYVQALYEEFTRNPDAVHPEWREIFRRGSRELVDAGLLLTDGRRDANGGGSLVAPVASPAPAAVSY